MARGSPKAARGGAAGLGAFGAFAAIMILWSWSVPLMSSPDEPHHVVKAAAVWRGEWLGQHAAGQNSATMTMYVPRTYARAIGNFDCYRQRAYIPAGCAPKIVASSQIWPARTHVGRYPPLYYILVGWPTALSHSVSSMAWMRVISALLNSALLAFGVFLIRRFRMGSGILVGYCCALTPVAIYMDSTIQPNGLEATLGLLTATGVVGLALHAAVHSAEVRPPRLLVGATGGAGAALCLVRGLSPLWLACLGIVAFILVPWAYWRAWLRLRDVRIWVGVILVTTALATAWILGAHALAIQPWPNFLLVYKHASDWREVQLVLDREGWFAEQMVGALTKETQLPVPAFVVAFVALCLLVITGFVRGTARERGAIGFSFLATLLIPVALAAPRVRQDGINWQGRYTIPFAVAIVLVSAMAAWRSGSGLRASAAGRRVAAGMIVGWAVLDGVCFWAMLRRYSVSTNGPLNLLSVRHPNWSPSVAPVDVLAAVVLPVLAVAAIVLVLVMAAAERDRRALAGFDSARSALEPLPAGSVAAEEEDEPGRALVQR